MERRLNPSTIYQGLFLVALALFAHERTRTRSMVATQVQAPETQERAFGNPLYRAYQRLKTDPLLGTQIDGVSMEYRNQRIVISVENDEIYANQEIQIAPTWKPFFERLADALEDALKSGAYEIKVMGFPDQRNALDQEMNALGKGALGLAVARADEMARLMKRKLKRYSNLHFELSAGSSASSGHRIEIQIQSVD